MLGIDLTKISRFANAKDAFIKKILHPIEIEAYLKSEDKKLFLASRWAIKEALYKADNSFFNFHEIEIKKLGRKYVYEGFEISTSKEDDYYIAIVKKGKNDS